MVLSRGLLATKFNESGEKAPNQQLATHLAAAHRPQTRVWEDFDMNTIAIAQLVYLLIKHKTGQPKGSILLSVHQSTRRVRSGQAAAQVVLLTFGARPSLAP